MPALPGGHPARAAAGTAIVKPAGRPCRSQMSGRASPRVFCRLGASGPAGRGTGYTKQRIRL